MTPLLYKSYSLAVHDGKVNKAVGILTGSLIWKEGKSPMKSYQINFGTRNKKDKIDTVMKMRKLLMCIDSELVFLYRCRFMYVMQLVSLHTDLSSTSSNKS